MSQVKAAQRGVDRLKAAVKALDNQFKRSLPLQTKFNRSLKRTQIAAIRAARGIRSAAKSLSSLQGVLGGIATGAFFKGAIDEAVTYEAALLRITRLEGKFKQLAGLQQIAAQSAEKLFVSQTDAARAYADLGARLGPAISDVKELQAVYEGLEIVLLQNAKSTGEAASLQLQLNQALGKGVLNGDEFRSIAENAPEVLRQLAIDAGISEQAIKDLAREGGITRDKLIRAFANLRNSGIGDFNALLDTSLGKIRKFDKAIADFRKEIGQQLRPAFEVIIQALTFLANAFIALPEPIKRFLVALTGVLAVTAVLAPLIAVLTAGLIAFGAKVLLIASLVTALGLALFELPNILRTVANDFAFVGRFFQDVWKGVTDYIRDTWIALNSQIKRLWRNTVEFLLSAIRFFGFGSGEVFEAVSGAWNALVNFMRKDFTDMLNDISNELNKFFTAFKVFSKFTGGLGPFGALFEALRFLGNFELPTFDAGTGLKSLDLDLPLTGNLPQDEDGKSGKSAKAKNKAKQDELKIMQAQLRTAEDLLRTALNENDVLIAGTEEERIKAQFANERNNLAIKYGRLAEKTKSDAEIETLVLAQSAEALNTKTKEAKALAGITGKLTNESKVLAEVWNGFGQAVTGVFDALIDGTEDWNSVLRDTLKSLSKVLIQAGLKALGGGDKKGFFTALTGGITGKASGGPVSGGTPYIVGEKGPELFVPGRSGNIVPNGASMGGNTVVNITVNENGGSSSVSQGDKAKEALALGRMVESSVVAIITREKRPGGILTRA